MTREQVYGRRPVREALRGRREVLELWATERAQKAEAWLRDVDRPRLQTKLERELSEAAGTRDHQGVLAWCEPYRYADGWELAAQQRPLIACLDQVTDPRNLGAVIRSADGAGATGVVVPAHGAATVTPAVCRASDGAVEHAPRRLPIHAPDVVVRPAVAEPLVPDEPGADDQELAVALGEADEHVGVREVDPRRGGRPQPPPQEVVLRPHDGRLAGVQIRVRLVGQLPRRRRRAVEHAAMKRRLP